MNKTRFSKLQKWILTTCYKKTILYDNSNLTILNNWAWRKDKLQDKTNFYWQYLFRQEILLDFFGCKTNPVCCSIHRFKGNINKYQVSTGRSLQDLAIMGYIKMFSGEHSFWHAIQLTDKGIEKAKDILNANSLDNLSKVLTISNSEC